jgi:hypothetical protein
MNVKPKSEAKGVFDAPHAALMGGAVSDAGRLLIARIRDAILEHERVTKPRKYARGVHMLAKFECAIGAFLADLLRAHQRGDGWISRSLRNVSFTADGDFSWSTAKQVVDGLRGVDMMDVKTGYAGFAGFSTPRQIAVRRYVPSKLRATPKLLKLAGVCGVPIANANLHFTPGPPKDPVFVRGKSSWDGYTKIRGRIIRDIVVPERITAEVVEINTFLRDFTLEGGSHGGFSRGFSNGDVADFSFEQGGRLYSAVDESYQTLEQADRLRMRISGAAVVEVDVRASFLTITHALHRVPLAGDPYLIPELGVEARDAVKMFVAASIGSGAPITKWSTKHKAKYLEDTSETLQRWPVEVVSTQTIKHHPFLSKINQQTASGIIFGWPALMWIESQAIVATMLDLLRNYGVPSFPVHDSLIVTAASLDRTVKQLRAHFLGQLRNYYDKAHPPEVTVHP